jgi:predicted RNase H-like nuclease
MLCIMPGPSPGDPRPRRPAAPTVAGVDGCPGGWVVARVRGRRLLGIEVVETAAVPGQGERICIDIPIGLPDTGRRAVEALVRRRLPGRGSTVFPTPVRSVLAAPGYAEANATSRRDCDGLGISQQTWRITARIAEVDALLSQTPGLDERIAEAHPELAFTCLNGGRPPRSKHTPDGLEQRRALLAGWLGARAVAGLPRRIGPARADDVLDALACAWVAQRWASGQAEELLDPTAPRDGAGRPMRILC